VTWILTVACSAAAMAADKPPLPPHEATYEVLRHGKKVGELMMTLEQLDTGIWHYRSDTRATAWWARALNVAAEEAAHFVWRGDRIMMLTYHHAQRIPANNRFFQHRTDWEAGTTEVRTENGRQTIQLVDNMVDPLSLRLQLAVNLADEQMRRSTHDFTLLDRDEEGDSIDWVNAGMAVALAVADSAPDLTGSRWEFYELSADYDGTALSEVFGFSGSIVDIDQEGNVSFDPFRDVAVVRNAAGTPERAVTFEESAPAEALSLTTAAGGQVTFQQDSAIMSGFVSADGQIMTLLVTDATANDSGLILGFRRSG